jgi:hypothetical protein
MVIGGSCAIKFGTYIIVPVSFTAAISFSLHTVVAIGVRFARTYALSYFLHNRTVQNFFNGACVKIAQHIRIAGTASFNITTGIYVQASPRGGAMKCVFHASN